jgi:hypothetical protein
MLIHESTQVCLRLSLTPMGELMAADLYIDSIEDAVELYLDAHRRKFSGKHGAPRKAQRLHRFLRYLDTRMHSMRLSDLALKDGQALPAPSANARILR